jgi:hypothetical protein
MIFIVLGDYLQIHGFSIISILLLVLFLIICGMHEENIVTRCTDLDECCHMVWHAWRPQATLKNENFSILIARRPIGRDFKLGRSKRHFHNSRELKWKIHVFLDILKIGFYSLRSKNIRCFSLFLTRVFGWLLIHRFIYFTSNLYTKRCLDI